jgi:hypothetical protein
MQLQAFGAIFKFMSKFQNTKHTTENHKHPRLKRNSLGTIPCRKPQAVVHESYSRPVYCSKCQMSVVVYAQAFVMSLWKVVILNLTIKFIIIVVLSIVIPTITIVTTIVKRIVSIPIVVLVVPTIVLVVTFSVVIPPVMIVLVVMVNSERACPCPLWMDTVSRAAWVPMSDLESRIRYLGKPTPCLFSYLLDL